MQVSECNSKQEISPFTLLASKHVQNVLVVTSPMLSQLGGRQLTYVAETNSFFPGIIVTVPGAYGWNFVNIRILADH